jgi:chlorite dismutase
MAGSTPETLNHFTVARFTADYGRLPAGERHARLRAWIETLRRAGDALHLYQLLGFEGRGDLLLWSACTSAESARTSAFFRDWAIAAAGMRGLVEFPEVLWGFTKPSPYTKTRSTQELDPFTPRQQPYLIVYPFVKASAWYQLDRARRQELMGGHIRVGTQYKEITQLLLYSFGLQDQEFVVVYETDDLRRFSGLVQELRATEARPYTERDAPLHSGLLQPDVEALTAWL